MSLFAFLKRLLRRIISALQSLLQLVLAIIKKLAQFRYCNGGSFAKTKIKPGTIDAINFEFNLNGKCDCDCLCIVSVFHFIDPKTKRRLADPLKGFIDGLNSPDPHGGFNVNGYAVDLADKNSFDGSKNKCPCLQDQQPKPGKKNVRMLTGSDMPGANIGLFEEHFETAVVCFNKRPFTVLGSMRWKKVNKKLSIIKKNNNIDHNDASAEFKLATLDWIQRFGKECCAKKEK